MNWEAKEKLKVVKKVKRMERNLSLSTINSIKKDDN